MEEKVETAQAWCKINAADESGGCCREQRIRWRPTPARMSATRRLGVNEPAWPWIIRGRARAARVCEITEGLRTSKVPKYFCSGLSLKV